MLIGGVRRGFTLIELLLATVSTILVVGSLTQSVMATQRLVRAQGARLGVQAGVRSAMVVVLNELRELSTAEGGSASENDILSISPAGLTYRAMRGSGFTCQGSSSTQLRISQSTFSGFRDPQPGRDSVLVYLDSATAGEPGWVAVGLTAVATGTACPGSIPALTLTIPPHPALAGKPATIPVRTFEPMELRTYLSEGQFWLGARSLGTGESIQPLFGPLYDVNGFELSYRSRMGTLTSDRSAIRSIVVTLRGRSELSSEVENQLVTEVTLRNARQ